MNTVSALVADLHAEEAPPAAAEPAAAQKPIQGPAVQGKQSKKAPPKHQASPTGPADSSVAASQRQQPAAADGVMSAGRGARQRSQPQPYWMTGAVAASSPAPRRSPAPAAASAAPLSGSKAAAARSKQQGGVAADGSTTSPSGSKGTAEASKPPVMLLLPMLRLFDCQKLDLKQHYCDGQNKLVWKDLTCVVHFQSPLAKVNSQSHHDY